MSPGVVGTLIRENLHEWSRAGNSPGEVAAPVLHRVRNLDEDTGWPGREPLAIGPGNRGRERRRNQARRKPHDP